MIKKILRGVAPFLGNMIGGPMGGAAMSALSELLLGKPNGTEEEIERYISTANPETFARIKQLDLEYKQKMAKIGLDEKKIASLDRDSARQREIKTGDRLPAILSILLTIGFFGILVIMIFYPVQKDALTTIDIMLGSMGTAWISCITYYFGSSHGSQIKTKIMDSKVK